jgi:prophage tail gpP-like protein
VIRLRVNGKEYSGWKTARVTRGIEAISNGFDLSVSDRWGSREAPWSIYEEDQCTVLLGDTVVITGYVDRRSLSYGPEEHTLNVSGRDKAGALVDCSALPKAWEHKAISVIDLARKLCEPFGISVSMDPSVSAKVVTFAVGKSSKSVSAGKTGKVSGLGVPKPAGKFTIDPGESAFDVLDRACRLAGVLPVSDGQGGVTLTRAAQARCGTELVQGVNILAASADFDAVARYRRYIVRGQRQATDDDWGLSAAAVSAEAQDETVSRSERVLLIRPDGNITSESAKMRAGWEAKVRAARGDSVTATVQGWAQADGSLWPVNALVRVRSPWLGVDGDMLITQAVHSVDDGSGTTTQLTLKRPDAFIPEPTVSKATTALWKELTRGV